MKTRAVRSAHWWAIASIVVSAFGAAVVAQDAAVPPGRRALFSTEPRMAPRSGCPGEARLLRPCGLEKAKTFEPPRNPDGTPNFQGFWGRTPGDDEADTRTGHFLEAHPAFPELWLPAGKSLVVDPPDGMIPYQPWARAKRAEFQQTYIDQESLCLPYGVPRHFMAPGDYRILQSPGTITFLAELAARIVPTDGRPHIGKDVRLWQGDSVGHWEGHTLVVETTNVNGYTFFAQISRDFSSAALRTTERYTMIDLDHLLYEITLDDPHTYTRPWTLAWGRTRVGGKGYELLEYACHEGEKGSQILMAPNLMFLGYPEQKP